MKLIEGEITEIGNNIISNAGTRYSNIVLLNDNGDRLRVSNLVCDDGTDNRIFIGNRVSLHLLQMHTCLMKVNVLVAVEDAQGLTVARKPDPVTVVVSVSLVLLLILGLVNPGPWLVLSPFLAVVVLAVALPVLRFRSAINNLRPTGETVCRVIEV